MKVGDTLRRELSARWPLLVVLVATVLVYARAMDSAFYGDDYIYLVAARDMGTADYLKAVLTPWGSEPLLPFTRDFWRPAAYFWFELAEPLFGGTTWPYHLANLVVHLASTVLVWALAGRLDARPAVRVVATAVFALYPGSFEAVTWISSVNSAGLVFALASWLAFLRATSPEGADWRWIWAAVALMAVGLLFRETSTALAPAMVFWFALMQRRKRMLAWRDYLVFLPFAALAVGYYLVRTKGLTEPFANADIYKMDDQFAERWWFYVKNALLPFRDPVTGWREQAQHVGGAVLLAVTVLAVLRKRWALVALLIGFLVSLLPLGAAILGMGQRYLYFSTPLLTIAAGILVTDALATLEDRRPAWRPLTLPAVFAVIVVVTGFSTFSRIGNWIEIAPDRQQRWVDGLRAEHPDIPDGGTLYCANVPLILALFGAANLDPTVRWYYPQVGDVVYHTSFDPPVLGPDDRYYVAPLEGVTLAQP